jgi:uncharacterized protein (TIGR02001 family)
MPKYLLVLSAMLMALPAFADFSTNFGAATEYTFRGTKLSDKDVVVSAGADYQGPFGVYAGAWGYTGGIEDLDTSQVNAYGGFAFSLGTVSMGLGAIQYVAAQQSGLTEYNINVAWNDYRLSTYQDEDNTYQYYEIVANYDIWGGNGLVLNIGQQDYKDTNEETLNYGIAWVVAMEQQVDFELSIMRNEDTGNVFTLGISRLFDW